jgi:hypothetical protein
MQLRCWSKSTRSLRCTYPTTKRYEYLTCVDGSCWCQGLMSGLMKPLPVRMVYVIEDI